MCGATRDRPRARAGAERLLWEEGLSGAGKSREVKGQSGRATSREIGRRCDAKALRDRLGTTWGRDS